VGKKGGGRTPPESRFYFGVVEVRSTVFAGADKQNQLGREGVEKAWAGTACWQEKLPNRTRVSRGEALVNLR